MHALNADGLRVVAVAYKQIVRPKARYSVADESGLTLLGFIAFLDPPKESVGAALTSLKELGVAVKILTGDNEIVTRKICRDVGLAIDCFALGSEIEAMTNGELAELVETITVFAKVSPEQKARIIAALHAKGHVVGFLGDGVNDGLALKAADVGVSVDSAVDIAKELADIILLEKNLLILQQGVLEGRKVFGNIIKYIKMGASSNFGSMFSLLGASVLLPFLPMLPIQVLANNLLYDFSQAAVPSDHVDEEFLAAPRKWNIDNIFKFMVLIGPISSIFDYTTFYVMLYAFDGWNDPSLFQTGWFVEVAADADSDHPCDPHGKDSLFGKSRQRGSHRRLRDHMRGWHRPALHGNRKDAEVHALAAELLANSRGDDHRLWGHDADRQNLVLSSLQHLEIPGFSQSDVWCEVSTPIATGGAI